MSTLPQVPEGLELLEKPQGLTLVGDGLELCGDFSYMIPRLRQTNLGKELLVRAAKLKGFAGTPLAVDATAGLGEDSLLLAAAGFNVILCERDPVIAALLNDALSRASKEPGLAKTVARMELYTGDSAVLLRSVQINPQVVYLDPMFPEKHKKHALTNKKLQLFQKLESPCSDETTLMQAAFGASPQKIIVKRPLKGPYLAGIKPSYSFAGKVVRYDCYMPANTRA